MAENKKSFILYADYINVFKELTNEEAGVLIKHLFSYVNDENPTLEDRLLKLTFEPIKQQLKRDLKTWEKNKSKKSESGRLGNLKRWNNDLYLKVINYEMSIEDAENEALNRKVSQCDSSDRTVSHTIANIAVTVNDNVTVNDTVNVSESKEELRTPEIFKEDEKKPPVIDLQNSNLYRKPRVPPFEEVHMEFIRNKGTKEMAESFYERNNSTEWFFKGSPIINFKSLVPSFVRNWKKNETGNVKESVTDSQLERINEKLKYGN